MGTTIFFATLVITMSFIVDVVYRIIDPRIQLESIKIEEK
jgi:ABC-type dipeptide/oligopeptide/nickel transport system permease component